jgi:hydrogenase-4 component B
LPAVALEAEALWDRWMLLPIGRGVQASGEKLQILEGGDFRVYCLYIVATLIGLLILVIG